MAEHPKDTIKRLTDLVEKTEGKTINEVIPTATPNVSELSGDEAANPVEILEKNKRGRGRPKGSSNKNLGFRKKDKEAKEKAAKTLWERGMVTWKLKPEQMCLLESFKNRGDIDTLTWVISRQWGKSYSIAAIIIEECLNNPGLRVAYVTPQKAQTRSIVEKNFLHILNDCPENLKCKFNSQTGVWNFKNGSMVKVAGMDGGHIENLRGQTFDIVVIDEAGFPAAPDFEYSLESVLFPTMTTVDRPLLLLISTPPKTYDHPFNDYWEKAQANGTLVLKTIYDSWLSPQKINAIVERYGADSVHFKREFLCQRIADASTLVIPEATAEVMANSTGEWEKPDYFKTYVSADYGVMDQNAVLFAYLDWQNNKVVIQRELIMSGAEYDTHRMAEEIKRVEQELWGEITPSRYCDNNLQIIRDFSNLHNLQFLATSKDDKQAAINQVRMKLLDNNIIIDPSCVNLLSHVQNATWDKSRKKFKRGIDHHYDTLDCLIYLIRNIDYTTCPFPPMYFMKGNFISPRYSQNQDLNPFEKSLSNMFTAKKKTKRPQ